MDTSAAGRSTDRADRRNMGKTLFPPEKGFPPVAAPVKLISVGTGEKRVD